MILFPLHKQPQIRLQDGFSEQEGAYGSGGNGWTPGEEGSGGAAGGDQAKEDAQDAGGEEAQKSKRKWLPDNHGHAAESSEGISSYTIIYGNKVATISIAKDGTPYGVVIEDAGAAAMQNAPTPTVSVIAESPMSGLPSAAE